MSERLTEQVNVATWPCDVCGEERPAYLVQITRHDVSDQLCYEPGSIERVVRHCCDRRDCIEVAEDPENWQILPERRDTWEDFDVSLQLVTGSGE